MVRWALGPGRRVDRHTVGALENRSGSRNPAIHIVVAGQRPEVALIVSVHRRPQSASGRRWGTGPRGSRRRGRTPPALWSGSCGSPRDHGGRLGELVAKLVVGQVAGAHLDQRAGHDELQVRTAAGGAAAPSSGLRGRRPAACATTGRIFRRSSCTSGLSTSSATVQAAAARSRWRRPGQSWPAPRSPAPAAVVQPAAVSNQPGPAAHFRPVR